MGSGGAAPSESTEAARPDPVPQFDPGPVPAVADRDLHPGVVGGASMTAATVGHAAEPDVDPPGERGSGRFSAHELDLLSVVARDAWRS